MYMHVVDLLRISSIASVCIFLVISNIPIIILYWGKPRGHIQHMPTHTQSKKIILKYNYILTTDAVTNTEAFLCPHVECSFLIASVIMNHSTNERENGLIA